MDTQHSTLAKDAAINTEPGSIPDGLKNFDSLPDSARVGSAVVRGLYGDVTDVTLWRWVKAGRVPAPTKMAGLRMNYWRVGDLRAALADQVQS